MITILIMTIMTLIMIILATVTRTPIAKVLHVDGQRWGSAFRSECWFECQYCYYYDH